MKSRIKNFLFSIVFFVLAYIVFSEHEDWVLELFGFLEIPHTGLLVAGFFALAGLSALILAFSKEESE